MRLIFLFTWFTQVASFPSKNHLQSIMVINISIIMTSISIIILIVKLKVIIRYLDTTWCGRLLEGRVCECMRDALAFSNSEQANDDFDEGNGNDDDDEDDHYNT